MKTIICTLFFAGLGLSAFSQETKVKVKKEKLYINDSAICIIDKKKKGMLDIPSFELRTIDEKPLGYVKYLSVSAPISGMLSWYRFSFEGATDTVYLTSADFAKFDKSMFTHYDDAIGKMIAEYSLVNNGQMNADGFTRLKKDFPDDLSKNFYAQAEKETSCVTQIKTNPAKSDAAKLTAATLINTVEVSKYTTTLHYEIKQDAVLIARIDARGNAKAAKKDDSEWDYSPGILDLDGGNPLNYTVYNADGCIIANYNGEERQLSTLKDGAVVKMNEIKKYAKEDVKSRLVFMQAITNYLVAKRYL